MQLTIIFSNHFHIFPRNQKTKYSNDLIKALEENKDSLGEKYSDFKVNDYISALRSITKT